MRYAITVSVKRLYTGVAGSPHASTMVESTAIDVDDFVDLLICADQACRELAKKGTLGEEHDERLCRLASTAHTLVGLVRCLMDTHQIEAMEESHEQS